MFVNQCIACGKWMYDRHRFPSKNLCAGCRPHHSRGVYTICPVCGKSFIDSLLPGTYHTCSPECKQVRIAFLLDGLRKMRQNAD